MERCHRGETIPEDLNPREERKEKVVFSTVTDLKQF